MNVCARNLNRADRRRGFTVVELVVAIAIVGILATIAIPTYLKYLDDAREAVLKHNTRVVKELVFGFWLDGYSTIYKRSGSKNGDLYLSTVFEESLEVMKDGRPSNRGGFVNPFSGHGSIVNWRTINIKKQLTPPAIFVTDRNRYTYNRLSKAKNKTLLQNKDRLRGTIVVNFFRKYDSIEIFFVGRDGLPVGDRLAVKKN